MGSNHVKESTIKINDPFIYNQNRKTWVFRVACVETYVNFVKEDQEYRNEAEEW